jgi:hypothetical protein
MLWTEDRARSSAPRGLWCLVLFLRCVVFVFLVLFRTTVANVVDRRPSSKLCSERFVVSCVVLALRCLCSSCVVQDYSDCVFRGTRLEKMASASATRGTDDSISQVAHVANTMASSPWWSLTSCLLTALFFAANGEKVIHSNCCSSVCVRVFFFTGRRNEVPVGVRQETPRPDHGVG